MSGSTDTGRVVLHFNGNAGRGRSEHRFQVESRDAKRAILAGYPVERPFESSEEAAEYLNHELLTCLLCGHTFGNLTKHIQMSHAMEAAEYKEKYCLPHARGLAGTRLSLRMSETCRETIKAGKLPQTENLAAYVKNPRKPTTGRYARLRLRETTPTRKRRSPLPLKSRECRVCGLAFERPRWSKTFLCSGECKTKWHCENGSRPKEYKCDCGERIPTTVWYRQAASNSPHLCKQCRRK